MNTQSFIVGDLDIITLIKDIERNREHSYKIFDSFLKESVMKFRELEYEFNIGCFSENNIINIKNLYNDVYERFFIIHSMIQIFNLRIDLGYDIANYHGMFSRLLEKIENNKVVYNDESFLKIENELFSDLMGKLEDKYYSWWNASDC